MLKPRTHNQIQRLIGKLVALKWFISRSSDLLKPFFAALKMVVKEGWDEDCDNAFEAIKAYIKAPPVLSQPLPEEELYVYLSISSFAMSPTLVRASSDGSKASCTSSSRCTI